MKTNAWEHYKVHIESYKHYFDLLLRLNVFYYAITGAILSFYFSHDDLKRLVLLFPALMSFVFSAICAYGLVLLRIMKAELDAVRKELELVSAPQYAMLRAALLSSGLLYFLVGGALTVMILSPQTLTQK